MSLSSSIFLVVLPSKLMIVLEYTNLFTAPLYSSSRVHSKSSYFIEFYTSTFFNGSGFFSFIPPKADPNILPNSSSILSYTNYLSLQSFLSANGLDLLKIFSKISCELPEFLKPPFKFPNVSSFPFLNPYSP